MEIEIPSETEERFEETVELAPKQPSVEMEITVSLKVTSSTICGAGTSSSTMLGLFGKISTLSVYFMSSVISGEL
jgi:hypothetical protein